MTRSEEARTKARERLVRNLADHERNHGRLPNMREVERKAEQIADNRDKVRDRK